MKIIEIILVAIGIFFVNWYFNPHLVSQMPETILPLVLVCYPIYFLLYLGIRMGVVSYQERSVEQS